MHTDQKFDVAVVGAGIAGSHLAQLLANHGINTLLIDQNDKDGAGPSWINAVPDWMFDEAHLSHPAGDELFDVNDRFIIRAPSRKTKLTINNLGVYDVHMGLLGQRLRDRLVKVPEGRFLQAKILRSVYDQNGRLVEIVGENIKKETVSVRASLFVDASGLMAVLRKSHPLQEKIWPTVIKEDICTAAQQTHEIIDREGALSFLEENNVETGDVLSEVGFLGGFSLFRTQINKEMTHVSFLAGVRSVRGYKHAHAVISEFVANNPWIGKAFISGRGAIPLNAPYQTQKASGLALLGDAACHVYATHGSGIGIGLIAARFLSDAVIEAQKTDNDLGSIATLSSYQKKFHKAYFHRLYFSEHFRRFSQDLSPAEVEKLIESGIMTADLARQTLLQEPPQLPLPGLVKMLQSGLKAPSIFCRMVPVFGKSLSGRMRSNALSKN